MKTSWLVRAAIASGACAVALLDPGAADACGGCFVQQTERTVVTDHRMALSVSTTQTVLWDQIRYSGDPAEFAWVLPVRAGAKVELSNDEFFTALDASTQPIVRGPATYGGGFGCGLTGCGDSTSAGAESSGPGAGQVQILAQSVVGPYETVTLRATDPSALRNWLKSHAFAIPPTVEPTIDAYVREEFDFIALRLRPDCGERAMQPVRITSPGADPKMPLRMVAAGAGAKVGLTLYVISEGRYQPQNFPQATVEESKLQWDRFLGKSNYEQVTEDLMAQHDGRTWVVEYADQAQVFTAIDPRFGGARSPDYVITGRGTTGLTPGFADAYYSQCKSSYGAAIPSPSGSATAPSAQPFTPCRSTVDAGIVSTDAGVPSKDAGLPDATADAGGSDPDAGDDDGGTTDGGSTADAGTGTDSGSPSDSDDAGATVPLSPPYGAQCLYLDDIDVALRGLHPRDVWVTRLRASLPANALSADDLRLEAAPQQSYVSNVHDASTYADETSAGAGSREACLSAPKRRTAFGSWTLTALAALGAVGWLRRRLRPRR